MSKDRDTLLHLLNTSILHVSFTKKDGSLRHMNATLKKDIVPQPSKDDSLSQKKIRAINEEVIPCWDVDKKSWRSFRVDSVIDYIIQEE